MRTALRDLFEARLQPDAGKLMAFANHAVRPLATNEIRAHGAELARVDSYQSAIRPVFGKGAPRARDIGDHPDFRYLKDTSEQVFCPITTMFMDMEGSTRLNLLYPAEKVHRIKNAFISAAIEIVQAFDGHVHRIMGDAVMAYFGGLKPSPEAAMVDALNAACLIRYLVEHAILPKLKAEGLGDSFGIRIGLDHGGKDDVLWASYGYPGTSEVTATSFYVDSASKLQHSAGRNQIMLGGSFRDLLDLPAELTSTKFVQRNGVELPRPFLTPNITDRSGNPINYPQFIWKWDDYLTTTPLASLDPDLGPANGMRVTCETSLDGTTTERLFYPAAEVIPKGRYVKFTVNLPAGTVHPVQVRFTVLNHGTEAAAFASDRGDHTDQQEIQRAWDPIVHWDQAVFRGLHYLEVEATTAAGVGHRLRLGVFVA